MKTFAEAHLEELEVRINKFMDSLEDVLKVVDVKYAIAHEAVATDSQTGVYPSMVYTALVLYDRK
ncbi:sporulation protein Cse60 [Paenibacillus sp. OV219]|uniref:sporulation protein Cse60 n=1 Tax=Paenibacillus sp. OV219 TaxID=1884377 RepID=UPI00210A6360|nr:sporulation protein Cse60 [Paenibacillus sp. OV219]